MKKLNYEFKDKKLLKLALTQSGADAVNNNERLEFLGDRVLGLSVATMLFEMFPFESEGELARRQSVLVSTTTLAEIATDLKLKVRHGHMTSGRLVHVMADAMEAVLGAIYIESGFETVRKIIIDIWRPIASASVTAPKDPKSQLQELSHQYDKQMPRYEFFAIPGKEQTFKATVTAVGQSASGLGPSKKSASIEAAKELLKILTIG